MAATQNSTPTHFRGSEQGLFTPAQIERLMRIEFDRAQRYKYPIVFLMISVDRLPQLQDLYGYEIKEQMLRELVSLLKAATRSSDALGMLVDDRLMALVPHTPPEGAGSMARRILEGVRKLSFECEGRSLRFTVSVGGAHNQHKQDIVFETLQEVAEGGLDVASQAGGDRYVHSELYDFFERKRLREERESGRRPPPPEPHTELLASLGQREGDAPDAFGPGGHILGAKIREMFGLGPDDQAILERIEQEVIAGAIREMQAELGRKLESSESTYKTQVQQLERRIAKLTQSLGMTEAELQRVMKMKTMDPGVASIYRSVQGLTEDDVQHELKKELMSAIFEANVKLREKFKEGG